MIRTGLRPIARGIAAAVLAATTACTDAMVGAPPAADHASVFDDLWHQVDLHYSFFELKHIDWDAIGARYRPLALATTSDDQFARVLSEMLNELHDAHVSLTPLAGGTLRYVPSTELSPTYVNPRLIFTRYVSAVDSTLDGRVQFGRLTPGVGYVRIASFEGSGWDGDIDTAIHGLSSAHALVIDVRDNGGGDYTLANAIADRFTDRRRTFGYIRRRNGPAHADFTPDIAQTIEPRGASFAGPVYVLTNRHAFSSAEVFVLAMRALPTATIVGDTTGGASGGPITRELPNGWNFQLSEWIEYTPSHEVFEGIGLAPDVAVKATAADAARGVDAVLERVVAMNVER